MRKLKPLQQQLLLAASIFMMIFMTSCEQDTLKTPEEAVTAIESTVLEQDKPVFATYNLDKEKLVEMDSSSPDEAEMNRLMLEYAEKIMEALRSERLQSPRERNGAGIKDEILTFTAQHNNDFIPIRNLANTYQERRNLPSGKGIERPITYEGVKYEFILNVPNIENADFSFNPIISPGLKARRDTDDSVFGWYLNDENMPEKILISEEQAKEMKNPLIVVSPHPVEGQPGYILDYEKEDFFSKEPSNLEKNGMLGSLVIDQYQVKNPNFYESSGGLEYRIWIMTSLPNSNQMAGNAEVKNQGVTRNDVSTSRVFNDDVPFGTYFDLQNFLGNRDYYILSYERDWARSKIPTTCSCTCHNATFYVLQPRMRYVGDFWNRICGKGDLTWPNVNSTITDNNNEGSITIKRTM